MCFSVADVVFVVVAGLDTIKSTARGVRAVLAPVKTALKWANEKHCCHSPLGTTYKQYQTVRPSRCMLHS